MSNIIQAELEAEQIKTGLFAIRQKGQSQNGCDMKTKHAKCSKN